MSGALIVAYRAPTLRTTVKPPRSGKLAIAELSPT
jgi:hypothetical protein